jgi:hypothetical protein
MDIDNVSKDYIAISTLPVPDIAALLKSMLKVFVDMISKGVANSISGASRAAFTGAVEGLKKLYDELMQLIDMLIALAEELAQQISALFAQLSSLSGVVAANSAAILAIEAQITVLEASIVAIEAEIVDLEARVTAIEAQLALATDVQVIGADGNYTTMSVLENTPSGNSAKREITYLDAADGYGYTTNFIIANNEPQKVGPISADKINYGQVDYIEPNGKTVRIHPLIRIDQGSSGTPGFITPVPGETDYTKTSVAICEDGTTTTKDILTTTSSS